MLSLYVTAQECQASEEKMAEPLKETRARKVALSARLEHLEGMALAPQIDRAAFG